MPLKKRTGSKGREEMPTITIFTIDDILGNIADNRHLLDEVRSEAVRMRQCHETGTSLADPLCRLSLPMTNYLLALVDHYRRRLSVSAVLALSRSKASEEREQVPAHAGCDDCPGGLSVGRHIDAEDDGWCESCDKPKKKGEEKANE